MHEGDVRDRVEIFEKIGIILEKGGYLASFCRGFFHVFFYQDAGRHAFPSADVRKGLVGFLVYHQFNSCFSHCFGWCGHFFLVIVFFVLFYLWNLVSDRFLRKSSNPWSKFFE